MDIEEMRTEELKAQFIATFMYVLSAIQGIGAFISIEQTYFKCWGGIVQSILCILCSFFLFMGKEVAERICLLSLVFLNIAEAIILKFVEFGQIGATESMLPLFMAIAFMERFLLSDKKD